MKGVWLILVAAAVFILILVQYVRNNGVKIGERRMPEKEDAYEIAKNFLRDDSRSQGLSFGNDGYSFGHPTDSVYVIKSTYEENAGGETKKGDFQVTLRYRGGPVDAESSWDVLNIMKD